MSNRATIIDNMRTVFTSFGSIAAQLIPDQWRAQSLCPAWDMSGVVVHVTAVETVLLGWRPGGDNPFAAMPEAVRELVALNISDLVERSHSVTAQRLAELAAMTDDEFEAPSITPVGPGT